MNEQWNKFHHGESVETEVNPLIYRSWQRSLNFKVDPTQISQNLILSEQNLRELREAQEELLRAAQPVIPSICQLLRSTHFTVLLVDRQGYILEASGDDPFLSKAQKIHLSPGVNWREEVKGTNAIGTALTENLPVTITGWEHFVKENHFLSCWAAPIQNSQGEIVGVLDISGEMGSEHSHVLDIAMTGAQMIRQNLHVMELERQMKFYNQGFKLASEYFQEGMIALNNSGVITNINRLGASRLGYKREEIIGKTIEEVFNSPKSWFNNPAEKDLHLKSQSGKDILSRLKPVTDDFGKTLGTLGTIQLAPTSRVATPIWIGSSPSTLEIMERAKRAASTPSSILIQGESGTGKEIIARGIHELSPRRHGPFVALNCAALPGALLESELFGYVEGAFTGARRGGQPGKFELAHQGTIFLDEIGDMPLTAQVALLRVLQEKEIIRVGDTKAQKIDVRVIAATHKDLKQLVESHSFRLDLFYRLKVVSIELPPLRERLEDIRELVPYFIEKTCTLLGRPLLAVDEEVYSYFFAHSWPGNVRELENCIESMVGMADGRILTVDDLPMEIREGSRIDVQDAQPLLTRQARQTIINTLAQTHGKIAPAARLLGIGRNTLYRKIKELNIEL